MCFNGAISREISSCLEKRPRQDSYSPAQLLFGHRQLTRLPVLPSQFDFYDVKSAQAAKDRVFNSSAKVFNQHKLDLPLLFPGDNIVIQHPKTGLWEQKRSILSIWPDGLSYHVDLEGRECIRARHMIKKVGVNSSVAFPLPQPQLHPSNSSCVSQRPNLSDNSEMRINNRTTTKTLTNQPVLRGCSSIGPLSGVGSAPSSSFSPSSCSCLSATRRTNEPPEKQGERPGG